MRPVATDVTRSVICASVYGEHGWAVQMQKRLNRSRCRLGADFQGTIEWSKFPNEKQHFWRDIVPAIVTYTYTHECIAHCSPAAAGECACPVDECVRRREGLQDGDAPFCQITFNTCGYFYLLCFDAVGYRKCIQTKNTCWQVLSQRLCFGRPGLTWNNCRKV